jgi:hypothetical protein
MNTKAEIKKEKQSTVNTKDFSPNDPKCTCYKCVLKDVCMYKYSSYNVDGKCLLQDDD